MDDFNPSPYKDMEQQIKQRRAAVNDAYMFNDLTKKEYAFEIAAVEIAVCNFIIDNPKWNTRLQKLEYILDMLVDMSDRNICIFLPEDEQAQQDYLIKEIFECLKEIKFDQTYRNYIQHNLKN